MTRDELVDAGARALADPRYPTASTDRYHRNIAGMVLDAVVPRIRADLRAKVEWMPTETVGGHDCLRIEDVLALIDGADR